MLRPLLITFLIMCPPTTLAQIPIENSSYNTNAAFDLYRPISLREVLLTAHTQNTEILAARKAYELSQTDIDLARTGRKPTISATAQYGYLTQDNEFQSTTPSNIEGETNELSLNLQQPLFRGFQTTNAIKRTQASAEVAQHQLRAIEQEIYLRVIQAYIDIQQDLSILELSEENSELLHSRLEAEEMRYALKNASLTDVAASKTALAQSYANIAEAKTGLARSRSILLSLTGLQVEEITPLPATPDIPENIPEFLGLMMKQNPNILSANAALKAAGYAIDETRGQRLPSVNLTASLSKSESPQNFGLFSDRRASEAANIGISVQIPIYQAGQEFHSIKRTQQLEEIRQFEVTESIISASGNVRMLWHEIQTSKDVIQAYEQAFNAAITAVEGNRKIFEAGLISLSELIDSEQVLLNSKISLERSKRDYAVAVYSALSLVQGIEAF